jgi:hypothetical protein
MDYEKKYKEALERAREVHDYYCDDNQQIWKIESIFPELKEDAESDDERSKSEILYEALHCESKGWEYTIPEGMFAEIKDGKIIVKQKAINDEVVDTLIKYFTGIGVPYKPGLREKCIAFLDSLRGMKMLPVFDSNKEIGDIFHIEKDGIKEAWTYMGPTIDK